MSTIQYSVPSIHCNHCVHTVTTELSDLEGVQNVSVSLGEKKVSVTYESPTTPEKIETLLAEINYPVVK